MRLSEKQAFILVEILRSSLAFFDRNDGSTFSIDRSERLRLLNEIAKQQSDEVIDLDEGRAK